MSIARRVPRIAFAMVIGCALVTAPAMTGRAQGVRTIRPATQPPQPRWSPDAIVVAQANRALMAYAGYSVERQLQLTKAALLIAQLRRAAMKRLIGHEPERAIQLSLRPGDRTGLPKHVSDLLETRVHARGDLALAITESTRRLDQPPPADPVPPPPGDPLQPPPGGAPEQFPPSDTSWSARIGQTIFRASVYGLRLQHQTKYRASLHGIALDEMMAVDESPLYLCDEYEAAQLGHQGEIVALDGTLPIPLPDIEAFQDLREDLIQQMLAFGPYPIPLNLHPWTIGDKRVLVINADYEDAEGTLYTDDQIRLVMGDASLFFQVNSQRDTSLTPTILPAVLRLPEPASHYATFAAARAHTLIAEAAIGAADDYSVTSGGGAFDPDDYDRVLVLTPRVFGEGDAWATVGGRHVTVTGDSLTFPVLAHEMGHTYGFIHSAFWNVPYGGNPIGTGSPDEYGDAWDMMGGPWIDDTHLNPHRRHFNPFFKALAGWLPASAVAHAASGGTFRLRRHDAANATGLRAIRVPAGAGTYYWIDMRRQFESNLSMLFGVEVRRVQNLFGSSYGPIQLLDMDPLNGLSSDHSLGQSETFTDAASGITIRVTDVGIDDDWYAVVSVAR